MMRFITKPLYALGITHCRFHVPGGRSFLAVTDDFGRLVEVDRASMPAFHNEH